MNVLETPPAAAVEQIDKLACQIELRDVFPFRVGFAFISSERLQLGLRAIAEELSALAAAPHPASTPLLQITN